MPLKLEDTFLKDEHLDQQMKGWKVGMDDEDGVYEWDQIEREMKGLREGTDAEFVECGAEHSGECKKAVKARKGMQTFKNSRR